MITIRMLGKNTVRYALGTFFYYSATILLLPYYTSVLSVSEYGALETLTVINQTLLILIGLGLSNALIRFYSESRTENEAYEMVRTVSIFMFGLSLIFISASYAFGKQISYSLLGDQTLTIALVLTCVWAGGGCLNELFFAYHRARHDSKTYVTVTFCLLLLRLSLGILLASRWGLIGILLANVISVWLLNVGFTSRFWSQGLTLSLHWLKPLLIFSLPLVVARLSWLLLNSADRYFLAYYQDLTEVGIYGLGYKAGLIVQIIVIVPFQLAWGPFVFSRAAADTEQAKKDFSRVFTYLVTIFVYAGLALHLFASEIVRFLGSGKFNDAVSVVPFVILAYFFNAVYYWAGNLFHLEKKTMLLSIIVVSMALLGLFLDWIVVPTWGWWGAAWVTVVTIGGAGLLTLVFSQRIYPVPLEHKRLAKIILGLILLIVFYSHLPATSEVVIWIGRLFILGLFPILLFIFGFFTSFEMDFIKLAASKTKKMFTSLIVKPT